MADLDTRGELVAPALLSAGTAGSLVKQILKLCLALFVASGVDVGQVVGHPGGRRIKGSEHVSRDFCVSSRSQVGLPNWLMACPMRSSWS